MKLKYFLTICLFAIIVTMSCLSACEDVNNTDSLGVSIEDNFQTAYDNHEIIMLNHNGKVELKENKNTTENSDFLAISNSNDEILGDSIYVEGNTFKNISDAIENAPEGSTIYLKGLYKNNGHGNIEIGQNISIIGDGDAVLDAEKQSRIFHITSGTVTIKGITFINGQAEEGGAIYFKNAISNSIINANFINNTAKWGGANYFACGVSDSSISGNYTNNKADYNGGANYFDWSVSSSSVSGNYFNNTAIDDGGGANYFWRDVSGSSVSGNYSNNTAKGGGANYFNDRIQYSNVSGLYSNNKALNNGGANFFKTDDSSDSALGLNITGNYANNKAVNNGSANYFQCFVSDSCVSGNYFNNTAKGGGANYFMRSVSGSNVSGVYSNNIAEYYGGAILFKSSGTVTNCNFTYNNATKGGAVYFNGTGTVSNCNFTDNKATGDESQGGAVYLYKNSEGNVTNCIFTDNSATKYGGAICFDGGSNGRIINCKFTNNTAEAGGAIHIFNYGNVTNCKFTNNTADWGGAIYFIFYGSVTNCNFTNNSATYGGSSIYLIYTGNTHEIKNCNFIDNKVTEDSGHGGAIYIVSGSVINCNFTNNSATYGGAIYFNSIGNTWEIKNCNFIDNKVSGDVSYGGAVYFVSSGSVTNCNFTGNNATTGSAIYFSMFSSTKTISNSCFLNNRANAEELQVTKNDNNITITFTGKNNLLNAIYSTKDAEVTFTNVTYWSANGITNTGSSTPVRSNREAGQSITVCVIVNGEIVLNEVKITDENGMIVLPIIAGENYYISARHDTDSYYTEAENTTSNMTFNVNVTSQTTKNKTVNITAESNILNEVIKGKLLFVLTNGTEINATYEGNGTWWAVHTFDKAGDYNVTASYIGLDNVTVNNAAISIRFDATVEVNNKTLDLLIGDTFTLVATTTPAGLNVSFVPDDSGVYSVDENGTVTALRDGNGSIWVKVVGEGIFTENFTIVNVTVSKVPTEISVLNDTLDLAVTDMIASGATLTPVEAGNLTYTISNSSVVKVEDGKIIALMKGNATITVSFKGDKKYLAAENKTINVTVRLHDAYVEVNNKTLDLLIGDTFTLVASTTPAGLNVSFVPDDSGVYSVDENGNVIGLRDGEGSILIKVGGDGVYAKNSTIVNITVSKIPTEITVLNDTLDLAVTDMIAAGATLTPVEAGNLTYTISNSSVVKVEDGKIIALMKGNATITVSFKGDKKYLAAENKTINVTVNLHDASVSVNNSTLDLKVDDTFNLIAATEPKDLTVNFTSRNSSVVTVDKDGKVIAISEGTATIIVSVGGDDTYLKNSTAVTVSVSKVPTEITVDHVSLDLFVGDETVIVAGLTPGDAGNVTFTSGDDSVVLVDDQGNVIANGKGQAKITVSFAGDNKYAVAENKTVTVDVSLNDASVTVDNDTLDLKVDETYAINATKHPDTILLDITYKSSDNSVAAVDENGIVTAAGEGTAIITLSVGDGEIYAKNSTTITVTVSKVPTEITVDHVSLDLFVGDETVIVAGLTPADAGNVTFTSGDDSVVTVDARGNVIAVSEGSANITVSFAGNDKYAAALNKTITVTVLKQNTTVDIEMPANITVGENSTVNVKLPGDATGNVTVSVDGEAVDEVQVTNGTADLTIPSLKAGNHTIEITYSGDHKYDPVTQTKDITVSKQNATEEISVDDSNVNVKLPGDATGNVTVKVDGETVSTVPVSEGTASVELPELGVGNHTVEVAYSGDDKYNPSTKTTVVSVDEDTTILTAKDVTATYKVDKFLTITLTDSQANPLANSTVTVELSTAKNYTSDENGQIKVYLSNLVPKTYTAKITFNGDDKYAGSNTTAEVTVKKATAKITAKAKTFKTTTKTKKYTVTLKANGKALKNKWVYLKVNGKTYKAKTNSKGKATFKITQLNKAGKFKATVTFKGNDYYKKATKKTTIKVKSAWKTIQKGSKNSAIVKKIQRALKNHGYYLEYNGHYLMVDGIFWDYTEMAVKEFQNDKTLKVTGKVDEKTARKLGII